MTRRELIAGSAAIALGCRRRGGDGPLRFPEIEVRGPPRALGRQIGEACREQVRGYVAALGRPLDTSAALALASSAISSVERFAPDSMEEIRGIAEAAGLSAAQVMLINVRNQLGAARRREGCTSIVVEAPGGGMAGQNWDNDPATDRFSVVLTRRPTGKPAFMSFTRPGEVAYIGLGESGIGLLMNAMPGRPATTGLPWYFLARAIYEQRGLAGVRTAVERAGCRIAVNTALVTPDGAADLEITPDGVRLLRADARGLLVHTNHFVHPDLTRINDEFAGQIFGQSFARKARAERLLEGSAAAITVDDMKRVLSDHEGHPQSVCRHPNDDRVTGSHRTVVSMIVEPAERRMHLTRGNPCERPYEVYRLT
jgi:isopenicillin-N N-acyltransferase-like protein